MKTDILKDMIIIKIFINIAYLKYHILHLINESCDALLSERDSAAEAQGKSQKIFYALHNNRFYLILYFFTKLAASAGVDHALSKRSVLYFLSKRR